MTRSAPPHRGRLARSALALLAPLAPLLALLLALTCATCAAPRTMVHTESGESIGRGTLLVVNTGAASLSFVDALTGDRITDLPVGEGPSEIAVAPGGAVAVVANPGSGEDGRTLTVVDVPTAAVTGTIDLGQNGRPGGMQFTADGRRLLVASRATGRLLVIDVSSRRLVRALSTGESHAEQVALQPDGLRVWISHGAAGSVSAIDMDRLVVVATLETGAGAAGLDVRPDGKEVWVCNPGADNLAVIDTTDLRVIAKVPCPGGPTRLRFTPDGRHVFVADARSGDVAVFTAGKRERAAHIPLTLTSIEAADSRLFGHSLTSSETVDTSPTDLLPSHDGQFVWVSQSHANIVTVLDLQHFDIAGRMRAGQQPQGLGWTPLLPGQF